APVASTKSRRSRTLTCGQKWTPEIDQQIIELRANNRTWEYISLATGRSTTACSDRFYTALDPTLRDWTPAMFTRLNQMVEEGKSWKFISESLGKRSITCQHQWRKLGNGTNLAQGLSWTGARLKWTRDEIDQFWKAWLECGGKDWREISKGVRTRNSRECRENFKALVLNAVQEAPGWVKVESVNYVSGTNRTAKAKLKAQLEEKAILGKFGSLGASNSSFLEAHPWTEKEHALLLKAVENHGLFSAWDKIRDEVKPGLPEDAVQSEYYKMTGMGDESNDDEQDKEDEDEIRLTKKRNKVSNEVMNFEWSGQEVDQLKAILSRYSHLPIWKEEAEKSGITTNTSTTESEFSNLFKRKSDEDISESEDGIEVAENHETSISSSNNTSSGEGDNEQNSEPNSESNPWTKLRLFRLKRLVRQQQRQRKLTGGTIDWPWVAEHIGPGFDENMCISQWQSIPAKPTNALPSEPRGWDVSDIKALGEGISVYGKSWVLIQRHLLPDRSTDSIRRKVTNIIGKRDHLVENAKEKAQVMNNSNSDVDQEELVKLFLEKDPTYVLANHLTAMYEKFQKSGNAGKKYRSKKKKEE
ncbi:hypothetical protein BGW38_001896, partial [Lunasporangiospora selenospora]